MPPAPERKPTIRFEYAMDTLTHALSGALTGRLLARSPARARRPVPPVWQAVLVGTVAGALPDVDFLLGYVSEVAYLRGHRGVTHSLLMLPLWGVLIAALMAGLFRLLPRRDEGGYVAGWKDFYVLACAALFVHILGDLITQFGTMIFAPLSDRRFGFGTTFIIDLGVSGILLAGVLVSAVWRSSRVPAAVAALALVAWVGNSAFARSDAIDAARAYAQRERIPVVALDAVPRPASPYNWTAVVYDGERYHFAHLNTRRSEPLVVSPDDNFIRRYSAPYLPVATAPWHVAYRFGDDADEELAQRAWNAEEFDFFRWFAMFPVLDDTELAGAPNGNCASFADLRFQTPGNARIPFRYGLCDIDGEWRLFEREGDGLRWLGS